MIRTAENKFKTDVRTDTNANLTGLVRTRTLSTPQAKPAAAPVEKKEKYNPKSDAPFQSFSRLFIGAVHFSVLVGIVGLLVAFAINSFDTRRNTMATVSTPVMRVVGARISGLFKAERTFTKGERVRAGEVLGRIETREIRDRLEVARSRWTALQTEILKAKADTRNSSSQARDQQIRQLLLDADALRTEIAQLEQHQEDLVVRSPVDGRIWFGLSGSKVVSKDEKVTEIWPTGGDLLIEIQAPLDEIHEILREGSVECRFATPEGDVVVTARPVDSTQHMLVGDDGVNGGGKEIFGKIVCRPDAESAQKILPGWHCNL